MKIIGFNLTKILVEKQEKIQEKLEIKQNINIDDVSKDKINITKNEILKIKFTFNVNYNPDFAKLEFQGVLVLLPEKEEFREIIKSWEDKKLTDKFRTPIFNFIMTKCNIKAINLEDEMALPLHIPLPHLTPKNE